MNSHPHHPHPQQTGPSTNHQFVHTVPGPQFRNPFGGDTQPICIAKEHAAHKDERFNRELAAWDPFKMGKSKR